MEVTERQHRLLELCAIQVDGVSADWSLLARQAQADGGLDDLCQAVIWERSAAARRSLPVLWAGFREPAGTAALVDAELEAADQAGAGLVTVLDPGYPPNLRLIANPPPFLFHLGKLQAADSRSVAVVGTRRPSQAGGRQAAGISRQLAECGFTVVSGLAAGIDTAAHQGTLEAGARTIAVLGSGITRCYPAANRGLGQRIARGGALVSQFWPSQPPAKDTFPRRNVVTSGISQGTVVIEAGPVSGARMQARIALEQGRKVFLLESLVAREVWAAACVERHGAIAVADASEVAAHLTGSQSAPDPVPPPPGPRSAAGWQLTLSFT